jgi:hypothetical protein
MMVTERQQALILEHLEMGGSLRTAAHAADLQNHMQIVRLKNIDAEFALRYARAREIGLEMRADSMHDTMWDMSIDAAQKRIIVDAQKWELGKLLPRYAERSDVNLTGKLEHAHIGQLSDATQAILTAIGAGSANPGDAAPVQD